MKSKKLINPLVVFGAKQKPDRESVDKIALAALVALDGAKRGAAPAPLANALTEHLMVGILLWARLGNAALYKTAVDGWNALAKACQRDTKLLDLTTGEYQQIRKAMQYYLRALPQLEVGMLAAVFIEARKKVDALC